MRVATSSRPMRMVATLAAMALQVLGASELAAQESTRDLTVRIAGVRDATVCACSIDGREPPRLRDLVIVAVGRRIALQGGEASRFSLAWVPELIPLIYSSGTADARMHSWQCGRRQYCGTSSVADVWTVRAVGGGLLPIALEAGVRAGSAARVRARLSGGAVYLTEPVPLAQGTKFNFVAEAALGFELAVNRRVGLGAAIVLNHISNGGLSDINLGMDSRLAEITLSLR